MRLFNAIVNLAMSLNDVTPIATIHPSCFYLRDDGDPTMQVGKWDF